MRFFKEGAELEAGHLPKDMDTVEMNEAIAIRDSFTDDERRRALYLSRLDAQRVALTNAAEHSEALQALEQAIAAKDQAIAEKEKALQLAEVRRLREERTLRILKQHGIDPDQVD